MSAAVRCRDAELFYVQCRIFDLGTDKEKSADRLRKDLMTLRQEIIAEFSERCSWEGK